MSISNLFTGEKLTTNCHHKYQCNSNRKANIILHQFRLEIGEKKNRCRMNTQNVVQQQCVGGIERGPPHGARVNTALIPSKLTTTIISIL